MIMLKRSLFSHQLICTAKHLILQFNSIKYQITNNKMKILKDKEKKLNKKSQIIVNRLPVVASLLSIMFKDHHAAFCLLILPTFFCLWFIPTEIQLTEWLNNCLPKYLLYSLSQSIFVDLCIFVFFLYTIIIFPQFIHTLIVYCEVFVEYLWDNISSYKTIAVLFYCLLSFFFFHSFYYILFIYWY